MYVRDARNRDEVWLLDRIEELGLDEQSFRSRDYVIAVDEETDERAGFGRLRIHKTDAGEVCELTSLGVLPAWRGQGVGAHVVERLVEEAGDQGFDAVYVFTDATDYLAQFGFTATDTVPAGLSDRVADARDRADDPEEVAVLRIGTGAFEMPADLRERFKTASSTGGTAPSRDVDELAEEFDVDDDATYKYDTGG
ncbi:MAG: GNAT family N-acetyltransferase [Halobaculum sp.]